MTVQEEQLKQFLIIQATILQEPDFVSICDSCEKCTNLWIDWSDSELKSYCRICWMKSIPVMKRIQRR